MKKILITSLAVLSAIALTGCGTKKEENKPTPTPTPVDPTPTVDVKAKETKVKLNNKDVTVKLDYAKANDEHYITISVNGKELTRVRAYGASDEPIEEVKYFIENATITTIKGQDKEYLLLSPNTCLTIWMTSDLYILSEDKAIAVLHDEENIGLKLTGKGIDKYTKNEFGKYDVFYTINNGKIYYLNSPDKEITNITEYVITINNDNVTSTKTGNTFVGSDPEGGSSQLATVKLISGDTPTVSIKAKETKVKLNNKDVTVKLDYAKTNNEHYITISVNGKELTRVRAYGAGDEPEIEVKSFIENATITTIKGQDKEYLLLEPNTCLTVYMTSDLYILSEDKAIAMIRSEENLWLKLTGNGSDKYQNNKNGSPDRYYAINNGKIYYLNSPDNSYKNISEYVITINNNAITSTKTGNTFVGSEPEGGDSPLTTVKKF